MELKVIQRDGSKHTILFDSADAESLLAYRWSVTTASGVFYAVSHKPGGQRVYMHRLVLPDTHSVDHINHNGLDNRRVNLRAASQAQQQANRRAREGGTSQFKGVSWDGRKGKWVARIMVGYKTRYLGLFTAEVDAARAYDVAAREAWGDYALPNFPTEAIS